MGAGPDVERIWWLCAGFIRRVFQNEPPHLMLLGLRLPLP